MLADELWEKYSDEVDVECAKWREIGKLSFRKALKEYGEAVKAVNVKVCMMRAESGVGKWADTELEESKKSDAWECLQCAAAIEREPLP